MPTYDYICTKCEYEFEHFQSMNSDPLKDCPECGGTLKRLIGAGAGPIFKGTGFYQTDYKNSGGSKKVEDAKTETKPSASPKPDAKTSKPESTTTKSKED